MPRVPGVLLGLSLRLGHPQRHDQKSDATDHLNPVCLRGFPASLRSLPANGLRGRTLRPKAWQFATLNSHLSTINPRKRKWVETAPRIDCAPRRNRHQGFPDIGKRQQLFIYTFWQRRSHQRRCVPRLFADQRFSSLFQWRLLEDRWTKLEFRPGKSERRRLLVLCRGWRARLCWSLPYVLRNESHGQDPRANWPCGNT